MIENKFVPGDIVYYQNSILVIKKVYFNYGTYKVKQSYGAGLLPATFDLSWRAVDEQYKLLRTELSVNKIWRQLNI
jgi:hypothetical protein